MLRSFDGLALRQLRTRRLRSLLTMSAVALGVGMMLGVLLLSGTVRATFDDLIDSAWGSIDLVVAPDNNAGTMSDQTLATVRATPGVKSAGPMVGASLTRLDSNGNAVKGQRGQMWVAGFETATPPYDFKYTAGHPPAGRNQVVVERAWADDRDLALGESFGAVGPTGRMRLRIVGLFEFTSGQAFGGPGLAGVTLAEARRLFDLPTGLHQISVHADDRDAVAALKARLKRTLGTRIDVQTPNE
ncbi:MAG TPA: ABC transporter permease, partial [Solirubrobacteraceae bacterium]